MSYKTVTLINKKTNEKDKNIKTDNFKKINIFHFFQKHCSYVKNTVNDIIQKELIYDINVIINEIKNKYYIHNYIIDFIYNNYKKGYNISINNNIIIFNPFVIHHILNSYNNMIIIGAIYIGMGHLVSLCIDRNNGQFFYTNNGGYNRDDIYKNYTKNTIMSSTLCNPKYIYPQKNFFKFIINNPFVENGIINYNNITELINY